LGKSRYTVPEIALLLKMSRRHTDRLLRGCCSVEVPLRGGYCKEYSFDDLPPDIQRRIIASEVGSDEVYIPAIGITQDKAKRLLEKWEAAPDWNRELAEKVRKPILDALFQYSRKNEIPITKAEWEFSELYNKRAVAELPNICFEKVDSLSAPNLNLLRRKYERFGIAGLLTSYGKKSGNSYAITAPLKIFIAAQLKLNPSIRPVRIHEMIVRLFPDEKVPALNTLRNFLEHEWTGPNAVKKEQYTLFKDPREWRNRYTPAFGDMSSDVPYFGHTWEQDSSPCDVIVEGVRYAGIFTIDVFSRRLKIVWAATSKSLVIAACTREALMDWGIPKRVRKDNGQDYSSAHIAAIYGALNVKTPPLKPHTPEDKPFIERSIGTFMRYLAEILPGYCGHSVSERQAIRERGKWARLLLKPGEPVRLPLKFDQLQDITRSWLLAYERRPHRGLGGKSPWAVANESRQQPEKIRDERILDVLLAPVANRTVQKKGIQLDEGFYKSAELVDHIGKRVQVRRDLKDAGLIYVFEIFDEARNQMRFLCTATDKALSGESLEEYLSAKNRKKKVLREKSKALNILSRSTPEPYTLLLDQGEVIDGPKNTLSFQADADTSNIREARKAVEAQGQEKQIQLETGRKVLEVQDRFTRKEEGSKWDRFPSEFVENENWIALLDWFEDKRQDVGLSDDEEDHFRHIKREFPKHYEAWEDMKKEKAASAVPPIPLR